MRGGCELAKSVFRFLSEKRWKVSFVLLLHRRCRLRHIGTTEGMFRVQLPERYRNNLAHLDNMRVRAQDGGILLGRGCRDVQLRRHRPNRVARLATRRSGDRRARSRETTLGAVTATIDAAIGQPGFLPNGVGLGASGDSQFFAEMITSMTLAIPTSAMPVSILMVALYGSYLTPFVGMFSIPSRLSERSPCSRSHAKSSISFRSSR